MKYGQSRQQNPYLMTWRWRPKHSLECISLWTIGGLQFQRAPNRLPTIQLREKRDMIASVSSFIVFQSQHSGKTFNHTAEKKIFSFRGNTKTVPSVYKPTFLSLDIFDSARVSRIVPKTKYTIMKYIV